MFKNLEVQLKRTKGYRMPPGCPIWNYEKEVQPVIDGLRIQVNANR